MPLDTVRRLCTRTHVAVSEIWTYHTAADQVRFTMVHRAPESEQVKARPGRTAPKPPPTKKSAEAHADQSRRQKARPETQQARQIGKIRTESAGRQNRREEDVEASQGGKEGFEDEAPLGHRVRQGGVSPIHTRSPRIRKHLSAARRHAPAKRRAFFTGIAAHPAFASAVPRSTRTPFARSRSSIPTSISTGLKSSRSAR